MIDLLSLATAIQNRVCGGLTARKLADAIGDDTAGAPHAVLSRNNEILASNTSLMMMRDVLSDPARSVSSGPGFEMRYVQASVVARRGEPHVREPISGLLGDGLGFRVMDGETQLRVAVAGEDILLPLPGPRQIRLGTFLTPRTQASLVASWVPRSVKFCASMIVIDGGLNSLDLVMSHSYRHVMENMINITRNWRLAH